MVEGGGFAEPVGGEFGAAGGAGTVVETFAESVSGGGVAGEGCALQAGDATGGVFGAANALEVTLAELVEGIGATLSGGGIQQLDSGFVVTLAAAAPQQAFGLLQVGEGW